MIVPDTNLLLYTVDSTSPFHDVAREWWTGCLNGAVPVGLCHPVVFAFARISTNRRAFAHPLSLAQVAGVIQSWSDRQVTRVLYPGPRHVHNVLELLAAAGSHVAVDGASAGPGGVAGAWSVGCASHSRIALALHKLVQNTRARCSQKSGE